MLVLFLVSSSLLLPALSGPPRFVRLFSLPVLQSQSLHQSLHQPCMHDIVCMCVGCRGSNEVATPIITQCHVRSQYTYRLRLQAFRLPNYSSVHEKLHKDINYCAKFEFP